jgi:hypothetical protein
MELLFRIFREIGERVRGRPQIQVAPIVERGKWRPSASTEGRRSDWRLDKRAAVRDRRDSGRSGRYSGYHCYLEVVAVPEVAHDRQEPRRHLVNVIVDDPPRRDAGDP